MSSGAKWWTRASAAVSGVVLSIMIPAYAWAASNGVADLATEAAKVRRRGGGGGVFGVLGLLCCLVVVGGIVLAVFLIMRNRKKPRP